MFAKRATAAKLSIQDIQDGDLITDDQGNVRAVDTYLGQVSRVNVIATVVDRYQATQERLDEQGKGFATITIDDGTGVIRVKMWGEQSARIAQIKVGMLVLVVGKVRSFQGETYINGELIRPLEDPNWETMRLLELALSRAEPHRLEDQFQASTFAFTQAAESSPASKQKELEPGVWHSATATLDQTVDEEGPAPSADLRRTVIQTIERFDSEGGARFEQIQKAAGDAEEEMIEQVLMDLLSEGLIYEPEIHRFKKA
jgi:RPA family protein